MIKPLSTRLHNATIVFLALFGLYVTVLYLAQEFGLPAWVDQAALVGSALAGLIVAWRAPAASLQVPREIIRACLVYLVAWYGVAKLAPGGQFGNVPLVLSDQPWHLMPMFWKAFGFFGSSPLYNFSMGAAECACALFIAFNRTRRLGLLMAVPILVNIALVNMAFNIGVLDVVLMLLAMALCLLADDVHWIVTTFWRFDAPSDGRAVTVARRIGAAMIVAGLARLAFFNPVPPRAEVYGIWNVEQPGTAFAGWKTLYLDEDEYGALRTRSAVRNLSFTSDSAARKLTITLERPDTLAFDGTYRLERDRTRLVLSHGDTTVLTLRRSRRTP